MGGMLPISAGAAGEPPTSGGLRTGGCAGPVGLVRYQVAMRRSLLLIACLLLSPLTTGCLKFVYGPPSERGKRTAARSSAPAEKAPATSSASAAEDEGAAPRPKRERGRARRRDGEAISASRYRERYGGPWQRESVAVTVGAK